MGTVVERTEESLLNDPDPRVKDHCLPSSEMKQQFSDFFFDFFFLSLNVIFVPYLFPLSFQDLDSYLRSLNAALILPGSRCVMAPGFRRNLPNQGLGR